MKKILVCLAALCLALGIMIGCDGSSVNEQTSENIYRIEVGSTYKLERLYEDSSFRSSDTSKATVSESGVVTGVAEGETDIIEENDENRMIYKFKVVAATGGGGEEEQKEYAVSLSNTSLSMVNGSSTRLQAFVTADGISVNDLVTWEVTEGNDVVELEDADTNNVLVKSLKTGKAQVRATCQGVSAVCAVTVTSENYQALPDISAEVVQGEKVTWTKDANAVEYRVSEDGGITWQTLATNEYAIAESDTPRSYDVLLVAVGDGINYGDSNALKLTLRTKLHFMVNGDNEIDFVGNGSDSYALYSGDTLLKDNIESGAALKSVLTSGDYSLKIVAKKGTEEKSSNVIDLQTGPINPYEINSFDSKKSEAEITAPATGDKNNAVLSYSTDFRRGESGYSLKVDCKAEYNTYQIRTLNDLTGVKNVYFYIYIDSKQFKNSDGTDVTGPVTFFNNGFFRSLTDVSAFTFTPAEPLAFDKWIRVNGELTDADCAQASYIHLQAANNPAEWGGEYVDGEIKYNYVFYIDDVYAEVSNDFNVENDTVVFDEQDGVTYDLYNGAALLAEDIKSGHGLAQYFDVTGDYTLTVKMHRGGESVGTGEFMYQTGFVNEGEINSFNSTKNRSDITAPFAPSDPNNAVLTYSQEKRLGNNGYSLKLECNAEYNSYYIRSLNDISGATNIYFYIYIDSTQFKNADGEPVSPEILYSNGFFKPLTGLSAFTFTPDEPLAFDRWIRVSGTLIDGAKVDSDKFFLQGANNIDDWTGGAQVGEGKVYRYVFYIDDVYIGDADEVKVENDTVVFTAESGITYDLYNGETLLASDIKTGHDLKQHFDETGDYVLNLQKTKNGMSVGTAAVFVYQTGFINENEINSFNSTKNVAEMTAPFNPGDPNNAVLSYSTEQRMGNSGYSLKLECNAEYNSYYLRSLNALTGVTKFSFYIYIDSTQFKNIDGTAASPSVLYNNGFIRSLNASNTFTPEKPLVFNEWIRVNAVITDTSDFEKGILLQAANNPVEWGGEYVEGAKAYSYVFYIDDVYMEA